MIVLYIPNHLSWCFLVPWAGWYTLACQGNVSWLKQPICAQNYTLTAVTFMEQSMRERSISYPYGESFSSHTVQKQDAFHFPESSLMYPSLHSWHLPMPLTNVLESHSLLGMQSSHACHMCLVLFLPVQSLLTCFRSSLTSFVDFEPIINHLNQWW